MDYKSHSLLISQFIALYHTLIIHNIDITLAEYTIFLIVSVYITLN